MTEMNRKAVLVKRPHGLVARDCFDIKDDEIPIPGANQLRVKIAYISLDPAMRGWMNDGRSYIPPVALGDVMRAIAVGVVDASNHDKFQIGDTVTGLFGVQAYSISDGDGVAKVDPGQAPLARWVGGLGMPGTTAYFGLLEIGQPKPGETIVVSAASGAVGSIVGQIAKLKQCRVVGIAGGADKCRHVVDELGFDACIDYKAGSLAGDLRAACPDGIDIYFESVGGEIFDTVLTLMNPFSRIPVCGLISAYNATSAPPGPQNLRSILVNRIRMQGFIVFDFIDRYGEAIAALGKWHAEGKLKMHEDIRDGGIDAYPEVLNELFSGGNLGKLVLKV